MRRIRIRPTIGERSEACASLPNGIEGVEQIPGAASEPIKLGNDQRVACRQSRDGAG